MRFLTFVFGLLMIIGSCLGLYLVYRQVVILSTAGAPIGWFIKPGLEGLVALAFLICGWEFLKSK